MNKHFFKRHKKAIIFIFILFTILLPFNNCKKYTSELSSISESSSSPTNGNNNSNGTNTSQPPAQASLVVSCVDKLQLTSTSSKMSFKNVASKLSKELQLANWDQSEDLVLVIDNKCLDKNNDQDPILKYLPETAINKQLKKSIVTLNKNSSIDLDQFNLDAMSSECLEAADFNKKLELQAVDPRLVDQTFFSSINFNSSLMSKILNYNGGQLYTAKVAVVDTGVDYAHPDIAPQIDKDINGKLLGINAVDSSSNFSDSGFHGTHVAGLIGSAYDNGLYGTGAYGKNIKIYPVRVSNDGQSASLANMATGIMWAINQKVDLINISMGGTSASPVLKSALESAAASGVFVTVAAGNDGKDLASKLIYPALYSNEIDGMITVGSFDASSLSISSFSNYSSTYVDILSPGSNGTSGILSTVPIALSSSGMGSKASIKQEDGTFKVSLVQGTSMATPVVTGSLAAVVSMAKGKGIRITPSQLERFIREDGTQQKATYVTYSRAGKYLDYSYLVNSLIDMIDSNTKKIEIDASKLKSQKSVVGHKVTLSAALTQSSKYLVNYQWYKNGTILQNATNPNLEITNIATTDAAEYQVEISSGSNKVMSQKIPVTVGLKVCD